MPKKTLLISILIGWSLCGGLAQMPGSPGNATNQLYVQLWLPHRDGLQAPAAIEMQAYVRPDEPEFNAGDSVNVEFFADSKSVGSAKAVWHGTIRPHASPGQATPMWIMPPGFYPAQCTWTNVPAGNYSLTARATATNSASAVSAPVSITVAR
ncbi:MAG TPA: Ig-like domain-containing protein [Pseudomonadales bacterium]|nr:Ig-like domain-containing protein [Pseudomonadales bacterium]